MKVSRGCLAFCQKAKITCNFHVFIKNILAKLLLKRGTARRSQQKPAKRAARAPLERPNSLPRKPRDSAHTSPQKKSHGSHCRPMFRCIISYQHDISSSPKGNSTLSCPNTHYLEHAWLMEISKDSKEACQVMDCNTTGCARREQQAHSDAATPFSTGKCLSLPSSKYYTLQEITSPLCSYVLLSIKQASPLSKNTIKPHYPDQTA